MWLYILIAVIVVLLITFLIIYNIFVRENNKVKEAFATMDVYLKKRWDLIPNIVETVKGYTKHEKDTLTEVIKMISFTYDSMSNEEKIRANENLSNDISKIMILAEEYPDLKASESFMNLSGQLTRIEDEIANSRKYYNATVRDYNNKVEMFPSNIIAKLLGYKSKSMFEASKEERQNIKVSL